MTKTTNFDILHWAWAIVTFVGSLFVLGFLFLAAMMIGFDSTPFNWMIGLALVSTCLLAFGAIFFEKRRKLAAGSLFLGSLYAPLAIATISAQGNAPPLAWWMLVPLNVAEVIMATSRLYRSNPVNPSADFKE